MFPMYLEDLGLERRERANYQNEDRKIKLSHNKGAKTRYIWRNQRRYMWELSEKRDYQKGQGRSQKEKLQGGAQRSSVRGTQVAEPQTLNLSTEPTYKKHIYAIQGEIVATAEFS